MYAMYSTKRAQFFSKNRGIILSRLRVFSPGVPTASLYCFEEKKKEERFVSRAEACCNTDYTNSITNIAFEFLFLVSCFVLFVAVAFCCVLLLFVVVVVVVVF